ncbi:unnamed protein product, partial [Arabidopsis halleri]
FFECDHVVRSVERSGPVARRLGSALISFNRSYGVGTVWRSTHYGEDLLPRTVSVFVLCSPGSFLRLLVPWLGVSPRIGLFGLRFWLEVLECYVCPELSCQEFGR